MCNVFQLPYESNHLNLNRDMCLDIVIPRDIHCVDNRITTIGAGKRMMNFHTRIYLCRTTIFLFIDVMTRF